LLLIFAGTGIKVGEYPCGRSLPVLQWISLEWRCSCG